jgi:hypothetical protein
MQQQCTVWYLIWLLISIANRKSQLDSTELKAGDGNGENSIIIGNLDFRPINMSNKKGS